MRKNTLFSCLFAALAPFACALDIDSWVPMAWKEYKPLPKIDCKDGVFHIDKVISQSGLQMKYGSILEASAGDDFILKAEVKGKGKALVKLQYYDGKMHWCGFSSHTFHIELAENWTEFECIIPVENTSRGIVKHILPLLEMTKGTEFSIKDCNVNIENNGISSSIPFPREWNVFILDEEMDDVDYPLDMIPEQIHGVHWKLMTINRGQIEFNTEFAIPRMRNNAILYSYLYSPTDMDYTIGAGADNYMNVYVNGVSVIDTMKNGNQMAEVHYSNYQATVPLHKGQNLIVVHFQSGSSKYPKLTMCGPDTLKNNEKMLKIKNYLQKGDLQNKLPFSSPVQPGDKLKYIGGQSIIAKYRPFIYSHGQEGVILGIGLKLYSLSPEGHLLYKICDQLSMKVCYNKHTEGMIVSVQFEGKEIQNLHLPGELWPCCLVFAANESEYFVNAFGIGTEKLAFASGKIPQKIKYRSDKEILFKDCNAVAGDFFTAIMYHDKVNNPKK